MSDRLAISAAFSVLAMAAFVLFGGQAEQASFGPGSLETPSISAPSIDVLAFVPEALLPFGR